MASGGALVMLHQAMRFISHQHTAMAIEMARDGGAFVILIAVIIAKDHRMAH